MFPLFYSFLKVATWDKKVLTHQLCSVVWGFWICTKWPTRTVSFSLKCQQQPNIETKISWDFCNKIQLWTNTINYKIISPISLSQRATWWYNLCWKRHSVEICSKGAFKETIWISWDYLVVNRIKYGDDDGQEDLGDVPESHSDSNQRIHWKPR